MYYYFPIPTAALLAENPTEIVFDTVELQATDNRIVREYEEVNRAGYKYSKCLPWVNSGLNQNEKLKALLTSLGVQGLDGLEIFGWSSGGNALNHEVTLSLANWIFIYSVPDGSGDYLLGVSGVTVDYTNCKFTLMPNK